MRTANLALPVPFSRAEMRDLVERARVAVNTYYAAADRDNGHPGSITKEHEHAAAIASHTLALMACFVGTALDASFVGSLAVWPKWDPRGGDHRSSSAEYFEDLRELFAVASHGNIVKAAEHEQVVVRETLAKSLNPENEFHTNVLWRLVRDSQYRVSVTARERLGAPWYSGVFEQDPAESLTNAHGPLLEKLAEVFTLKWHDTEKRDPVLDEVLPQLPDVVALPLLAYQLQNMASVPSEVLVQDLLRRPSASTVLARVLCHRFDHSAYVGRVDEKATPWLEAAGADRTTADMFLQHLMSDGPLGFREHRQMQLPKLIADCWKPAWDPIPLFEAWVHMMANATRWSAPYQLVSAMAKADDVASLREPLFAWVRKHGVNHDITGLLGRVLEVSPPEVREDLLQDAEQSPHDSFVLWALAQRKRTLTSTGDATQCRTQMRAWLNDARTRALIEGDFALVQCALPELRPALGRGELSLKAAETIVGAVSALFGGAAEWPRKFAQEREKELAERRARIEPWLSTEQEPLSDAEWNAYRAVRDTAPSDGGWKPGHLPEGPWDPRDKEHVERQFAELDPDAEDFQSSTMLAYETLASKPDASFLPQLLQLQRWHVEEELPKYWFRGIEALIDELSAFKDLSASGEAATDLSAASKEKPKAPARLAMEEEWMDTEEDES